MSILLNPKQQEACEHFKGPAIVSAAPGSGKTSLLSSRFEYLVNKHKIPYNKILTITFTNKAANELVSRISKNVKLPKNKLEYYIGTFHSIFLRFLRQYHNYLGLNKNFAIYDDYDSYVLMKNILTELNEDAGQAINLLQKLDQIKSNLLSFEDAIKENIIKKEEIVFFEKYNSGLINSNAIDFSQILLSFYNLLRIDPDIKENIQSNFDFIMGDETQDNNYLQYKILEELSDHNENIMLVGDIDQCIPEGEIVETEDGNKYIEDLKIGEYVYSSVGGKLKSRKILNISESLHDEVIEFKTKSGKVFKCTKNHGLFCKADFISDFYYLYISLSRKHSKARLGFFKGDSPKKFDGSYFIIDTTKDVNEARSILKSFGNYYGGKQLKDNCYEIILTGYEEENCVTDLLISAKYQNYVIDNKSDLYLKIFKGSSHGSSLEFGSKETSEFLFNYADNPYSILNLAKKLTKKFNILNVTTSLSNFVDFNKVCAANVFPGMKLISINPRTATLVEDEIISKQYIIKKARCFDLEIELSSNFNVNGVIVSNSLYGFRHAVPKRFLDFKKRYPNAKLFYLDQNYRSTKNIVGMSLSCIENNKDRFPIKIFTENKEGSKVKYASHVSEKAQAEFVVKTIKNLYRKYPLISLSNYAVLFRSNSQVDTLEQSFINHKLPYYYADGLSFFQTAEIKDILAYLKFLNNPYDFVSFSRMINTPNRGIGDVTKNKIKLYSKDYKFNYEEAIKHYNFSLAQKQTINFLLDTFKTCKSKNTTFDLVNYLIGHINYIGHLNKVVKDPELLNVKISNINKFKKHIQNLEEAGPVSLENFLEQISIFNSDEIENKDKVNLMTVHSSKGLEYDVVFLIGANNGMLPHFKNLDIEEERRIFYVGSTRAKKLLILSSFYVDSNGKKFQPSRFISELDPKYIERYE